MLWTVPTKALRLGEIARLAAVPLYADDTPVVLLNPRRTAYASVYVGDPANPYTVFDLSAGRSQEFPAKFLAGYGGFIHADAYADYNPLYAAGATHVGCWMHARRNFFEAKDSDPARAHEALARIRLLYAVEAEAKATGLTGADLAVYRQEHAGPGGAPGSCPRVRSARRSGMPPGQSHLNT